MGYEQRVQTAFAIARDASGKLERRAPIDRAVYQRENPIHPAGLPARYNANVDRRWAATLQNTPDNAAHCIGAENWLMESHQDPPGSHRIS
jgi:hypothetical protein